MMDEAERLGRFTEIQALAARQMDVMRATGKADDPQFAQLRLAQKFATAGVQNVHDAEAATDINATLAVAVNRYDLVETALTQLSGNISPELRELALQYVRGVRNVVQEAQGALIGLDIKL